ncbi:MAG: peptidase, partial [Planctomycetota bacterium]
KAAPKRDLDALKRHDAWQRRFSPRGSVVAADLDPEHWLCFGAGERLPVYISGSDAWMSKRPAATPARLAPAEELRLSGLMWPEARQRWAGTAYATVERIGNGQVILFANDPFYRAYYEGSARLLLNAVMLGPGMGTRQPLPW